MNWETLKTWLQPGRSRLFSDPYYRFQSLDEVIQAAKSGIFIDANQAGVDDWLRLPGISIHQARSLVALRQSGVQLHSLEDLAAAVSLPLDRLKPLEPILRFCYYAPDSANTWQRINPNTASIEMLTRIPAIDLFLARTIVQNRVSHGTYHNLADLQQRLSLSSQLTTKLMHYFSFE
jgi:DNA uptake protein ComE-like DNA-binding protein